MKKLALALVALALTLGGISPAFAWDHRNRNWREKRHYRPYPYYRPYYHPFPQIIIPIPIPLPPVYTPYPTYPVYPPCTQIWVQPQWVWDVLSNQLVFDPGHWQTICQ